MKRNSILFLISLILGILFCYFLKVAIEVKIFIIFIFIFIDIFLIFFKKNKNIIYFFVFFSLGFIITFLNTKESKLFNYFLENVNITADVLSKDNLKNKKKYEIYILQVNKEDVKEKSVLFTDKDLEIGDRISFRGKIKELKNNTNPTLFNFKKFNLKNKIYTKTYLEKIQKVKKSESLFLKVKKNFHLFIKKVFDLSLNEKNSNIMKRIFLSSKFDTDFDENVNEIGISHIIAISGLHVGIIYILLNKIFYIFHVRRFLRDFLPLIFIFLYGNLISNPASLLRAEVFLSFFLLTTVLAKIKDSLNNLFLSLLLILIINPFMIFDVGLYLSSLSVFAIIYILPFLKERKDKILTRFFKLTLSIFIINLPILLYIFKKVSILTFIANIILVPVFVFVIILSFFMILLSLISFKLTFFSVIIDFILDLINFNIDFLNEINVNFYFYNFTIALILLYYFLVYIFIERRSIIKISFENKKFLFSSIFIMLISISAFNFYKDETKINFLDISQGDCALIRTNSKNFLFDTGGITFGSSDNGKTVLIPYLKNIGIKKLDYVFISHLDMDHCKNLKLLCEKINVKNVVFRKNGYKDYLKKYGKINAKNIFDIEENKKMKVGKTEFSIFQIINSLSENDKSIVINVKTHNKKILFTGDIGVFTENQLLKKDISCDFLKVSHHGSKYSSSSEFLKLVNPKYAIISCGYKNRYNHPHKEAIDRIKKVTKNIYRTDLDANIIVKIDKFGEKIVSFNKINNNLLESLNFYFEDVFLILLYLFSFTILILIRRNYELYRGFKTFRK